MRVDPALLAHADDPREQGRALGHPQPAGIPAPRDVGGDALVADRARQSDALPDRLGGGGDRRRRQDGHDPQRLEGVAEHGFQPRPRLELPRLVRLEMGVGRPDELPRRFQCPARRDRVPCRRRAVDGGGGRLRQRTVGRRCRALAAALGADHGRDPRRQVAEVVGEVGVVAGDEAFVGEVAVLAVRGVGEDVVPEPVDADRVHEVERLDDVAGRLAHLLAAAQQPAADGPAPWRLDAGRHQHRRPVHAVVADDVLADQVVVDRPPLLEALGVGAEPDGRQVVGQRVEPHVGDVGRVPRQRDAPRQAGAAGREVAQPRADQPERLVGPELRHDRAGVGVVPLEQPVLEPRQPEEVVLLLELLHRQPVDRAQPTGQQFVVGVVLLAADAVLAPVEVELEVTGVVAALEQLEHPGAVPGFGGADEVVVGDLEVLPRLGELWRDRIGERLRIEAGGVGGALDVEAVLVGSGEEQDVVAEQSSPARQRVTDDGGVGVPEVRFGVDVVDRRRRVEPGHAANATSNPPWIRRCGGRTWCRRRTRVRRSRRRRLPPPSVG